MCVETLMAVHPVVQIVLSLRGEVSSIQPHVSVYDSGKEGMYNLLLLYFCLIYFTFTKSKDLIGNKNSNKIYSVHYTCGPVFTILFLSQPLALFAVAMLCMYPI